MSSVARRVMATLPRLRAEAEALMTSTWLVQRPADDAPLVGLTPTPTLATVYEGRGKLQSYEGNESRAGIEGSSVTVQRLSIHFPVGAFTPTPGDIATCTASTDAAIIGRRFRVSQSWPVKEHATAYRVAVDEVIA